MVWSLLDILVCVFFACPKSCIIYYMYNILYYYSIILIRHFKMDPRRVCVPVMDCWTACSSGIQQMSIINSDQWRDISDTQSRCLLKKKSVKTKDFHPSCAKLTLISDDLIKRKKKQTNNTPQNSLLDKSFLTFIHCLHKRLLSQNIPSH